ncbi:MAG: CueP family metal-binding protein [Trueperaceae bacterium]|nr:CueP family metal-binding protein [Trueperaceae bacterium]
MTHTRPLRSLALVLVITLVASAFGQGAPSPRALEGLDARAAVELANTWKGNGVTAFATPEAVQFAFPNGAEVSVPMPDDVMFVSVAPYLQRTHPCATHYLSGCQGELVGVPVHVQAILADGTVLIDEVMPTMANGFIDLWLPRDQAIDLHLSLDGAAVVGRLTTFADSRTCITDLQLTAAR